MVIFEPFDERITSGEEPWTRRPIQEPEPTLWDFKNHYVAIPEILFRDIKNNLDKKGFCLITGGANTGKTWLSYAVGYKFNFIDKKPVYYGVADENFRDELAWKEIKDLKGMVSTQVYKVNRVTLSNKNNRLTSAKNICKTIITRNITNIWYLFGTHL